MPKKQILYFSAAWCGPCNNFKQKEVPKLKDLKIGKDADSNIRIIDIDILEYKIYLNYF